MLIDIMTVKLPKLVAFQVNDVTNRPLVFWLNYSLQVYESFIQFWRKIFSVGKTDKQFQSGVFWWLINTWVGKFDYWINLNLTSLIILLRMFAGIQVEVSVVQWKIYCWIQTMICQIVNTVFEIVTSLPRYALK